MNTIMGMSVAVALLAGLLKMNPTNVYKICAWGAGTLEVEPWRVRSAAAVQKVSQRLRSWFGSIWLPRLAVVGLVLLLALVLSHLSVSHDGILLAVTPIVTLKANREQLLQKAAGFKKQDGTFADDQARTSFDAAMTDVEAVDAQIRTAEAAIATPPTQTPEQATELERTRGMEIRTAVRVAGLDVAVADDLIGRGVTIEKAREAIFAKMAERSNQNPTAPHVATTGEDARDKWLRGVGNWLIVRAGKAGLIAKHENTTVDKIDPGEFRGMSLLDVGKDSLTRAGVSFKGRDRMDIAGLAMAHRSSYQTTSDFATVLENVLHKILRAAYVLQVDTWSAWCGVASVSDFRTQNWYRLGSLTSLDDLNEQGEFKNKQIPDAEKATYSVATKGNIIAITRQVIVNDDLGAMTRLSEMLGRAGKLTIEKAAYALLAQNAGLGPTQSDGQALFHANRNNVNAAATAITVAGIDADRVVMAQQKDVNAQDFIGLRPEVLLVPVAKGSDGKTINDAQYDPIDNKFQKPNTVRGLFSRVVDTPRLTGTRRYLFANVNEAPVFLVSFLEGQQEPVLETQDGWRTDGVEMKARLDVGVDAVDFRGAVTNAGA